MDRSGKLRLSAGSVETVNVHSSWDAARPSLSMSIQTEDVYYADAGSQCVSRADAAVQAPDARDELKEDDDGKDAAGEDASVPAYGADAFRLMGGDEERFFLRAALLVEEALGENAASTAFDGYKASDAGGDGAASQVHALRWDPSAAISAELLPRGGLQCTGVDWSCTGSTVAASFGQRGISGWCETAGAVVLWNLFARSFRAEEPSAVVDHSSCVTCLSCHPARPAVLAAGSFNGEVLLLDMGNEEEPVRAVSAIDEAFHCEAIASVAWLCGALRSRSSELVVSLGRDGRLLFWDAQRSLEEGLRGPVCALRIDAPAGGGPLDANCFAIGADADLLIGSSTGELLRCFAGEHLLLRPAADPAGEAALSEAEMHWSRAAAGLLRRLPPRAAKELVRHVERRLRQRSRDAVAKVGLDDVFLSRPDAGLLGAGTARLAPLERSAGAVCAAECHGEVRNLCAQGTGDGTLRLLSLLHSRPVAELQLGRGAVRDVRWSRSNPNVLAAACEDGSVCLYELDALEEDAKPRETLRAGENAPAAVALAFNPRQRDFLAVATAGVEVQVWRLPWHIANARPREAKRAAEAFRRMANDDALQ